MPEVHVEKFLMKFKHKSMKEASTRVYNYKSALGGHSGTYWLKIQSDASFLRWFYQQVYIEKLSKGAQVQRNKSKGKMLREASSEEA